MLKLYAWSVKRRFGYRVTATKHDNGRYMVFGEAAFGPFSVTCESLWLINEALKQFRDLDERMGHGGRRRG